MQSHSSSHHVDDYATDFPDDASVNTTAESEDQPEPVGAEVQMVNGVQLPNADGYLQTSLPIATDGNTQTHVVVASRHPIPADVPVVIVAPHNISPFAASNLQTRSSSFASD